MRSSWVSTASTPGSAGAALRRRSRVIRPRATVDAATSTAWAELGDAGPRRRRSRVRRVTFLRPSMRSMPAPIGARESRCAVGTGSLGLALVSSRRTATSALAASSTLKALSRRGPRAAQRGLRPPRGRSPSVAGRPAQRRLGLRARATASCATPPSARRTSRDRAVVDARARRRPRRARTRSRAVAHLEVASSARRTAAAAARRAVISSPGASASRGRGRRPAGGGGRRTAIARVAVGPCDVHDRVERGQRHAMSDGWVAMQCVGGAEDRVVAVEARRARRSRCRARACCSGAVGVAEVGAARALQQVAADGGHVAQLRRGAGSSACGEHRVAVAHRAGRAASVAVARRRRRSAGRRPAVLDRRRAAGAVTSTSWSGRSTLELHQVDEVGAAGRGTRRRARAGGGARRLRVVGRAS